MDSFVLFLLIITIWFLLLFAGVNYFFYRRDYQEVDKYLAKRITPRNVMSNDFSKRETLHRWMDAMSDTGNKIELLSDPQIIEKDLILAGYPYGLNTDRIQGAKVLGAIGGGGLGFLLYVIGFPLGMILFVFLPVMGYMAPMLLLKVLAKKRQEKMRLELPDFMDMMSITLKAGMGLDEALAYYVTTNKGPLSEEFARLNQEIQFGVQREAAYRSLMERTTSSDLEALIQSMIQANNLGTPIAETFAQQAEEMRRMRAERAKEAAGKAAPKISLVSAFVIAPSIVMLILSAFIYSYFVTRNIFG
ncbi:type II secretion system F family protein [Desmospora profundinema]|uniref:Tight adherence protein C n=1 Tax=Desmospora profundinema TaxID=1571184 RepID=A0ABU1IT09_9BACL|nr:type II secretion system F family protein [Desmospora profundinema]MDR6227069.1 tight adherence protein C [Desmospora profundinema]